MWSSTLIDEIGYLPIDRQAATLFFQFISRRYERGPMILTSNQSFGSWGDVFGDRVIASAILDRILHHATTISIRGDSYRLKDKLKSGVVKPTTAGILQTPTSRSIWSHVAKRTSPDRAAVRTRHSNPHLVGTEAWEARTVASAYATVPSRSACMCWTRSCCRPRHHIVGHRAVDPQEDVRHCGVPVNAFLAVQHSYDRMSVNPIARIFMAIAENKSERLQIPTTSNLKALPQRAAASSHKNVTEFLLKAGINAAEDALVDRRMFRLDDRQWQAFQAILDRPVAHKPGLTRLLAEKSVLE